MMFQHKPNDTLSWVVFWVALIGGSAILACCDARLERPSDGVVIDGKTYHVPDGYELSIESDSDESKGASLEKGEGTASGKGAGLTTDSQDAVNNFNTSSPNSWLPGIGSTGGSADIASTLTGKKPTSPLLWAGILAAVGGAVAFYFGLRRAALVCLGLSGALIAASFITAWAWIILALAGVSAVAFYVWAERKNLLHREALRAVTAGVESLDTVARGVAKSAIAVHADDRDKATIKAIKKADDLPSERA